MAMHLRDTMRERRAEAGEREGRRGHRMGRRGGGMRGMMMARAEMASDAPTPVAAGEVNYSANVNVTFELTR